MPDAIASLKEDHKKVKALFREFEKAGETAHAKKKDLVTQMIRELSVHASIEEQVFYPACKAEVPDAKDEILEGLEEHHVVKWTLAELEDMDPSDERYKAKVTVLIESVRHHIEEEEGEMFPQVREALGRKALQELGEELEAAKKIAPTRPHPKAPDEPPGNIVAGAVAGVVDKARDALHVAS